MTVNIKNSSSEVKKTALAKLKEEMLEDTSLPLRKGATNLVFGEGNPEAKILFIGEGPGYWEDQKGEPFVGRSGNFLTALINSLKLKRTDVFITNVVHYRPPENRDPTPEELQAFKPYLDKIIKIIDPKVIVTLGRFSMGKFIPNVMISKVHGREFHATLNNHKISIIPMYHPSAGLRSSSVKEMMIKDFKKLGDILESK
jgi:DNA polymerase